MSPQRRLTTTYLTAQPYLGKEYMSPDGVHPDDQGYEVIADRLQELGYYPLSFSR